MRHLLGVLIGIAVLALAGCVYPDYGYVRGDYGSGYYTGNAYYYDGGYAAPAYYYGGYGGYGCCGWYGPSVNVGIGYYGGGYYRHGYRGYYGHGWSGRAWHGRDSRGSWHGGSHGSDGRHHH